MNSKEDLKKIYERRLNRTRNMICSMEKKHGKNPSEKFTYYGGWNLGYYKGLFCAYEEILDDIDFYLR